MTVVLREGPYKVMIYVDEPDEPPHVHVLRDACRAKFWLLPVAADRSRGFKPIELRRIQRMLELHAAILLRKWHERHGR
jgi:hypothetical protein